MRLPPKRRDHDLFASLYNVDDTPEEIERKLRLHRNLAPSLGQALKARKGVLECCRGAVLRCRGCGEPLCIRHVFRCVEKGCRTLAFCEKDWGAHLFRAH